MATKKSMTSVTRGQSRMLRYTQLLTPLGNRGLQQVLTDFQITNIKKVFFREESRQLNQAQLEKAINECGGISFADGQFDVLFLRINIKRDGYVTWDEFISHLILGFKIQEVSDEAKALDAPISKKPRMVRSNHRHPISVITFNFQVKSDRSCSYSDGSYITCSKDGFINYWSLDLQVERTVQSKCPDLKVTDTWVLSVVCLPDVSVICTSSTERDLRFYDTSAKKFELRVQITSLEYGVCSMCYVFQKDVNEDCKLIMGDMGGNIIILLFSPLNRGPFRSKLGIPLLRVRYDAVLKGMEPGFRIVEFRRLHRDWVRQIEYYYTLNFIVSCSVSHKAIVMRDINENRGIYTYCIPRGAWCFTTADGAVLMASGGPDCLVRVWNPYVTRRPLVIFHGHHTGVISLIMQDKGEILCSLSEDKCIKIWDIPNQACMQTYLGLGAEIGEHAHFTMFYNPDSRQLLIGGLMIAVLPLRPLQSGEHTDGNSHSAAISVVLYNPLFKIILTCGLDSNIIVWDPWSGKRISVVKEAHTRMLHGEIIPVDITAGTFDPGYQLLLTGAYDGSLKTWNFNTGTCLRNMRIERNCEVTGVVWVNGRILAVGWNRHVTEFSDSGGAAGPGGAFSKPWSTRHSDDVLCASARIPQTLATSTYNGELVLWQLETGQPYKQYNVANPTARIKINYNLEKERNLQKPHKILKKGKLVTAEATPPPPPPPQPLNRRRSHRKSIIMKGPQPKIEMALKFTRMPKELVVPDTIMPIRGLAVRCMQFLPSRPMHPKVGSLLVALENGDVQVWSHHISGSFIGAFQAVHGVGDYVLSMASDSNNEYLFTGSTEGYIKTFLLKGFYENTEEKICMPLYRLTFPFLWKRMFEGRAMRTLKDQHRPILLNSYKAHRSIISGLIYIHENQILVSTGADYTARLWTLGGRYLGTLGTFKPWDFIDPDKVVDTTFKLKIPPDIRRVMSSTTCRVLMGEHFVKKLTKKQEAAQAEKELEYKEGTRGIYGKRLEHPILGNYINVPEKTTHKFEISLDSTFPYIPVYQHLIRPAPVELPDISNPMKKDK
ncbi:PREDICTED: WD repeat-containing protein on Y chromosome [Nicrophorus vespilloides]|uniref:WD repeat-containing protein on Y chromosome n=1 Tax=Nicrophorus vespilloides TaxID=110193 RepID=A0ABM1NCM9_NICVS|nr:PREDICTED: WD repeat-containing protein on Y chromosome [Nicrophorus vespilloides]